MQLLGDESTPATLYYSGPHTDGLFRRNMTIMKSVDDGLTWEEYIPVDKGEVSYSALQIVPPLSSNPSAQAELGLLYERSDTFAVVFEPDQIVFVRYPL